MADVTGAGREGASKPFTADANGEDDAVIDF
jgi:hypothetical protein